MQLEGLSPKMTNSGKDVEEKQTNKQILMYIESDKNYS